MSDSDTIRLAGRPRLLPDLWSYLLAKAEGKRVLNVGAGGGVQHYLPDNREVWLHHRLEAVARELVGIDIDRAAVEHGRRWGVELIEADCESMDLGRRFELIVMSDVIEHLDRPGQALGVLVAHLEPEGRLIVTTPNPTYAGTVARAVLNRDLNVYHDHVAGFLPEHLAAMCARHGCRLAEVHFLALTDRRSPTLRLKSAVMAAVARAVPRLSGWLVAEIAPGAA